MSQIEGLTEGQKKFLKCFKVVNKNQLMIFALKEIRLKHNFDFEKSADMLLFALKMFKKTYPLEINNNKPENIIMNKE